MSRFFFSLAVGVVTCALLATGCSASEVVIHQERSLYRNINVIREGDAICLTFRTKRGVGKESCKFQSRPKFLLFEYNRMMLAGLLAKPRPRRVAVIGLGGGSFPEALQEMLPGTPMDFVELDDAVVRVARKYFNFVPARTSRIHVQDGRVFVKRAAARGVKYDLVFLDAFDGDYIPEHLLTREFLLEVKSILAPGGVVVANTFSGTALTPHESATYHAAFGPFYSIRSGNRIIIAGRDGAPPIAEMQKNAALWNAAFRARGADANRLARAIRSDRDWPARTQVLTDQYSPSNVINAR